MKTAIIHEWLVNYAGSERVLEQIVKLFPDSDLFCQVDFLPVDERNFILDKKVKTTFIQKLPLAKTKYRNYLPLMPFAVRRLNVSNYDLIISNSHSIAKGIRKNSKQLHICYCHTPMRYIWDLQSQYLKESGLDKGVKGAFVKAILNRLRKWDVATSKTVDYFIVNSYYIKNRLKRSYGRDAVVIYPPVDIAKFELDDKKENFFLTVSRMVPYKKIDLIVEAFSEMGLPLIVIGDGPDFEKVKNRASNNIEFLGFQEDDVLKKYMQKARAFIFAAEEDFGIVPVEAQACGTPVIAFGKGGVTETVIPLMDTEHGKQIIPPNPVKGLGPRIGALPQRGFSPNGAFPTGIFFNEQTPTALINAIKRFETSSDKFDPNKIRRNAERFSTERFKKELKDFVDRKVREFQDKNNHLHDFQLRQETVNYEL